MSLEASKRALLEAGGKLSHKATRDALVLADNRARAEASATAAPPNAWAASWIKAGLGRLAVTFFILVLVGGTGALLVVIPAAEYEAVREGLLTITPDRPFLATLTGAALFIGTLVLMFLKNVYQESAYSNKPLDGLVRKLRGIAAWLGHRSSVQWVEDNPLTVVQRNYTFLVKSLNFAKFAIVSLSLIGRLKAAFDAHGNKPLGEALISIRDTLTGTEAVGIVASFVLILALLYLLDAGVLFSFASFRASAGKLDLAEHKAVDFLDVYSALREQYQAEALDDLSLSLMIRKPDETPQP